MPRRKELFQILSGIWCSVIETGRCMDFSSVHRAVGHKLAKRVRVGRHEYRHIFGRDSTTVFVGDGKRDVVVLVIPFVSFRDRRLILLDSYTPLIPGVIQPDRAVFCLPTLFRPRPPLLPWRRGPILWAFWRLRGTFSASSPSS